MHKVPLTARGAAKLREELTHLKSVVRPRITEAIAEARAHGDLKVDLADAETGDELTYQIVGEDEADIKSGMISITSPIARALIGKREGDVASVQTPGGTREFDICEVRYI